MDNLAGYNIRAWFSQESMIYRPADHQVTHRSKGGKQERVFDVFE